MNFEQKAEIFWQRFGYFPPGKDNPIGVVFDDKMRQKQWAVFLDEVDCKICTEKRKCPSHGPSLIQIPDGEFDHQ